MSPVRPTYERVKNSRQTVKYGSDEVGFLAFGRQDKRFLLTEKLNDSLVVIIASSFAAIGAHIPYRPASTKAMPSYDDNVVWMMNKVARLYTANKKLFPDPDDVVVIYGAFQGDTTAAFPSKKQLVEKCLRQMGLRFTMASYIVKQPSPLRAREYGTAFVDGVADSRPNIYLADKLIHIPTSKLTSPTTTVPVPVPSVSNPVSSTTLSQTTALNNDDYYYYYPRANQKRISIQQQSKPQQQKSTTPAERAADAIRHVSLPASRRHDRDDPERSTRGSKTAFADDDDDYPRIANPLFPREKRSTQRSISLPVRARHDSHHPHHPDPVPSTITTPTTTLVDDDYCVVSPLFPRDKRRRRTSSTGHFNALPVVQSADAARGQMITLLLPVRGSRNKTITVPPPPPPHSSSRAKPRYVQSQSSPDPSSTSPGSRYTQPDDDGWLRVHASQWKYGGHGSSRHGPTVLICD